MEFSWADVKAGGVWNENSKTAASKTMGLSLFFGGGGAIPGDATLYHCITCDERVTKESLEMVKKEINNRISRSIKPEYVVNYKELVYYTNKELLNNNPEHTTQKSLSSIKSSYDTLSEIIRKGKVTMQFPLSGAQKLRLLDAQNVIAYFDTDDEQEKVEQAILKVINEQGLLRCFLIGVGQEYMWEQHDVIEEIHIPMVDLSELTPYASENAVKEIAETIFKEKYGNGLHALFQMILIKINENKRRVLV